MECSDTPRSRIDTFEIPTAKSSPGCTLVLCSTYQVARSAEVVAEAERSISWTSRRRSIPWEDAFLGVGLAKVATSTEGHEPIAAVHAGMCAYYSTYRRLTDDLLTTYRRLADGLLSSALYSEHQLYANATLIYHAQHLGPAFIGAAQARSFVRSVHRVITVSHDGVHDNHHSDGSISVTTATRRRLRSIAAAESPYTGAPSYMTG